MVLDQDVVHTKRCRNAGTILLLAKGRAVDIDLENFFDKVNQCKLIEIISKRVKDGWVISLINKYLNTGAVINNKLERTEKGGPLSPLLSNIMLNELDKELKARGYKFARYADDLVILTKSKRSAKRVLQSITNYIEENLNLKMNREKTQVAYVSRIKYLDTRSMSIEAKGDYAYIE